MNHKRRYERNHLIQSVIAYGSAVLSIVLTIALLPGMTQEQTQEQTASIQRGSGR